MNPLKSSSAVLGLLVASLTATADEPAFWSWAKTPPMGWNSWDCNGAGVWESNALANAPREISVALNELGLPDSATVRDLWNRKDLGVVTGKFTQTINSHGAGLYRLQPHN